MQKKLPVIIILLSFFQLIKAQTEFITIWKPNNTLQCPLLNPQFSAPANNQILFPGIGENYTIKWEEVGYPQHNGSMLDVTSSSPILIDFGPSLNPNLAEATYMLIVSNGNGIFKQIKFSDDIILPDPIFEIPNSKAIGSANKIVEITQWGNIQWTDMKSAFSQCGLLNITATDSPDLSHITDASMMFYNTTSLEGNSSMANWDTSRIKNFKYMFGRGTSSFLGADNFSPPIGTWDMSAAEDISYMFMKRKSFNENLNNWNTSTIANMAYTFAECTAFNQPLDQWNTSKVKNMAYMFHFIPNFNQPLNTWNTSNVTNMGHMFHDVSSFNYPLNLWDVSNVTEMNTMFSGASAFNQTLKDWNIKSLYSASSMITKTGMDCGSYSTTLYGWANHQDTPNNVVLGSVFPSPYSIDPSVIDARNILLNTKGWIFIGDTPTECKGLGTMESSLRNQPAIFPNPVDEVIQLKNFYNPTRYLIFDTTGKLVTKDDVSKTFINVQSLAKGNYILQVMTKDKNYTFKFIKK
ncbi:hypothetical protein C1637_07595 [Chryseobacterium lactis]|uniref:BspA family leucine-rich repeat surface protein n=1 Tax=Chryseobacterium lactis TaxID=1241981 RepID=A0A3G6RJD6_CHRLC|nr:BspA family leucine-rich repeat surface protein [Chryseobacterium lactis]AZA84692.1 BspA family leucine-rich repeat surface protein [Chryseobacterium lactis]AZB05081.1 BspA family leucine-rich repeat surface protein [Chryseobacterium lactis]PNW14812.1 hypothetical protein C1637_07595 [Chryseobacterium lactis]